MLGECQNARPLLGRDKILFLLCSLNFLALYIFVVSISFLIISGVGFCRKFLCASILYSRQIAFFSESWLAVKSRYLESKENVTDFLEGKASRMPWD